MMPCATSSSSSIRDAGEPFTSSSCTCVACTEVACEEVCLLYEMIMKRYTEVVVEEEVEAEQLKREHLLYDIASLEASPKASSYSTTYYTQPQLQPSAVGL